MKKLISVLLCVPIILLSSMSFATAKEKPEAEPDGYVVVYSESKTNVVTKSDEIGCATANWAFLTAYTLGADIILAGATGFTSLFGLEQLHEGEVVTTHTSITYDRIKDRFEYTQRTIVKNGTLLISDYASLQYYHNNTRMYGDWKREFKGKLNRGYLALNY